MTSITSTNLSLNEDDTVLTWTVHLAHRYPGKLAISLFIAFSAAVAAYYAIGLLASFAVIAVMISTLADFLFPVRFVVTGNKAICYSLLKRCEIEWKHVKRCWIDEHGIKLSPLSRISRMEAFRGVYLRFDDNNDRVIDAVKLLWKRDGADIES